MASNTSVEREVLMEALPAAVWAALTEPEQLSAWFGAAAETSPDGAVTFNWDDGTVRRAVIDVFQPERLLVLRWLPFERDSAGRLVQRPVSTVVFTLTPAAGGTLLRVVETPLALPETNALKAVARL